MENSTLNGSQLISKRPRSNASVKDSENDLLEESCLLTQCLKKAGFLVKGEGSDNLLQCDQAVFLKKFIKDVSTDLTYPENIETMFATLSGWLDSAPLLAKLLSPTPTSPSCTTARSSLQESLLRLLLLCPQLQPRLLPRLLERLAEISLEEAGVPPGAQQSPVPRLILTAVRCLDRIEEPRGLADKMIEVLTASSRYHQVEVLASLPEMVPDQQHVVLFDCLKEMLEEREPLVAPILDCFSNLSLIDEKTSEIRNYVLKLLPTAALPDLPIMVDFLTSSLSRDTVRQMVPELRASLDLSARLSHARPSQRPGPRRRLDSGSLTVEKVVVDKLAALLSRDKEAAEAWLGALQAASVEEDSRALDLVMLVVIHTRAPHKRAVESLLRNKVRAGVFMGALIKDAFRYHIKSIGARFPALLDLSEVLLLSSEGVIVSFAREIYSHAFGHLDPFCQQEIVSDMVSKVGIGGGGDVTVAALGVLSQLAEERCDILAKYGIFISAVLDFMDRLELSQVKVIMSVLATVAWGTQTREGNLENDLVIIIKKQINSANNCLRRIGIVGAVSAIRAMILAHSSLDDSSIQPPTAESSRYSSENSKIGGPLISEAAELLNFVKTRTDNSAETGGLFLDELSSMLASVKSDETASTVLKLTRNVSEDFQAQFIDCSSTAEYRLGVCTGYALDTEQDSVEEPITLPIASLTLSSCGLVPSRGEETLSPSLAGRLLPNFKLLTLTADVKEEIDALLGCGIETFQDSVFAAFPTLSMEEKTVVLSFMFNTANWFLEILNSFAPTNPSDTECYKNKVLLRLQEHLNICETIKRLLKSYPTFRPPAVHFSEDLSPWNPPEQEKAKKGEDKIGNGKGKKTELTDRTLNATLHLVSQQVSGVAKTQAPTQSASMEAGSVGSLAGYKPFFRELDLGCLAVLGFQSITTESEGEWAEELSAPKFRPREFLFIVNDLLEKLDHCLDSGKKKGFPGKTKSLANVGFTHILSLPTVTVIENVIHHLGHIFSHLEDILGYFQRLASLNDGIVDAMDRTDSRCVLFNKCLRVGFKVVSTFFSWHGFLSAQNNDLLIRALVQIAERSDLELNNSSSLVRLIKATVHYLSKFAPNLLCVEVAGAHLDLVSCVSSLAGQAERPYSVVSALTRSYLGRDWRAPQGDKEKGAGLNKQVEGMLRVYLVYSKDIFASMELVCREGIEIVVAERVAVSQEFPFVTRGSLGIVYKVMLAQLSVEVRKTTFGITKDLEAQLEMWSKAIGCLSQLVACLKLWQNRLMLGAVLKHSRPFLDHFVRQGMPLVEKLFRRRREQCLGAIKELQQVTRYLQAVCIHSKIQQDVSLANNVPLLKRTLEILLYRNKAMLAANDCLEAFVFGNLKNKDLAGNVILSQETGEEDADEGSEDGDEGAESDVELGPGEEVYSSEAAGDASSIMSDVY